MVGLCWTISIFHIVIYFFDGCDFYYYNSSSVWGFSETPCGILTSWISDVGFDVIFLLLIFSINITTFVKMYKANRSLRTTVGTCCRSNIENNEQRRKGEIHLFKLSCIHASMFLFEVISFNVLSKLPTEFWGVFFTTSFTWQVGHACNSFVFIMLNSCFRKFVFSTITCRRSTTSVDLFVLQRRD